MKIFFDNFCSFGSGNHRAFTLAHCFIGSALHIVPSFGTEKYYFIAFSAFGVAEALLRTRLVFKFVTHIKMFYYFKIQSTLQASKRVRNEKP